VPQDAQDYKNELKRIEEFTLALQKRVIKECEAFSEDIKHWAEFKTGIKQFKPWLETYEKKSLTGLAKPQTLEEANAMYAQVKEFESGCAKEIKVRLRLLLNVRWFAEYGWLYMRKNHVSWLRTFKRILFTSITTHVRDLLRYMDILF
jgi:hypothetical protein